MKINYKWQIGALVVLTSVLTAWAGEKTTTETSTQSTKVRIIDEVILQAERDEATIEELSKLPAPAAGMKIKTDMGQETESKLIDVDKGKKETGLKKEAVLKKDDSQQ